MKIIKTSGHCYDGPGWADCEFWRYGENHSECTLFGENGVAKEASKALIICDKVYGLNYEGEA